MKKIFKISKRIFEKNTIIAVKRHELMDKDAVEIAKKDVDLPSSPDNNQHPHIIGVFGEATNGCFRYSYSLALFQFKFPLI